MLWGWSLNGVFSVLASVGAIYSAIYMGTTRTFAIAASAYLLAGIMLLMVRRSRLTAEGSVPSATLTTNTGGRVYTRVASVFRPCGLRVGDHVHTSPESAES